MHSKNEYRRSIDEYRPAVPVKRKIGMYWVLAALRIILTLIPQTGYIHPDEYFQSVEVISGDNFDIDVNKPWEFNSTFPIRTILIPQIIVGIPYSILNILSRYTFFYMGISLKSPYFLILFPRLLICGLSFISDYCLYKICYMYGQNYKIRLITYASSYVMFVYSTRTLSNSTELVLTALLLYYTSHSMAYSEKVVIQSDYLSDKYIKAKSGVERVKYYKLKASLPPYSLNNCLKIATVTVIGIFNRPTFIAFAFPPIFFWLQRGLGSKSVGFVDFHIRIFTFIACGIPTTVFFIIIDSFYFGYLTMAEIGNLDIGMSNFVVTPLNFLKYNSNTKNLQNHGLHPRYIHLIVNVPLLYNILGIVGLLTFGKMIHSGLKAKWLDLPRIQSVVGLMTTSFIIPIILLSIFPHQEPRFIIPTLLPLAFLYAPTISQVSGVDTISRITENNGYQTTVAAKNKLNKLQIFWFTCNILLTFFYGFAHQGGVLPLTSHIATELKAKPELTHIHLFTSHTYPIPTALLHLRNTKRTYISSGNHKYKLIKDFYLYEQGSKSIRNVCNSIALKLHECDHNYIIKKVPYRLYYALPATDLEEFIFIQNNTNLFNFHIISKYYPHVTIEKLPFSKIINSFIRLSNINIHSIPPFKETINDIFDAFQQFQLLLIRIEYLIPNKHKFVQTL
ncbi:phosphatidylinositol glycan anchor biosynthesis class Z [Megachile rotundata]|uniref:phosphatidylinositol glycan anchor biosynthesis class Z n=1 Tax=Megachile rotundata TaxID=143995 RepID=UPI000258F8BA|nr:PREDICTED: GPI mannosyltransferase 4 [Megachile rotundata]